MRSKRPLPESPFMTNVRFQDWTTVGEKTFKPDDLNTVIGSFVIGEDHDTIWVRITQTNGQKNSPWSYGILGWKTSNGYELGSVKAYGELASEVFRLGIGRPPYERTGSITFDPRHFNLAWIKNGYPWSLKFEVASGKSCSDSGSQGAGVVVGGFVDTANNGLPLVRVQFPDP